MKMRGARLVSSCLPEVTRYLHVRLHNNATIYIYIYTLCIYIHLHAALSDIDL